MSATIRDVARRAGVSISTVSRALNNSSPVAEDKRRLIYEAAEALGYAPHPAARSLQGKQTGAVGVLLPFVSGEFFSELLNGLDGAAQELGLLLLISTSHRRHDDFRKAVGALDKRVDGLVVMAPELGAAAAASLARPGTPVVFVNTRAEGVAGDTVNFDNAGGAAALTRHLIGLGHRRIAHVRGREEAWDAGERARGYREAMAEAGLGAEALEIEGGYTREAGHAAAQTLLSLTPRPTAVVAANDYCALGVMGALREAGLSVPADVSVCGFDGLTSGQFTVPTLTSVRVPIREIGAQAVHRLAEQLAAPDGEAAPRHEVVPVTLVARDSTSAPPGVG